METSILIGSPSPRAQQVRNFLKQNNLQAWIAWRPDELLMLSGYFPFWGASFLVLSRMRSRCSSFRRLNRETIFRLGCEFRNIPGAISNAPIPIQSWSRRLVMSSSRKDQCGEVGMNPGSSPEPLCRFKPPSKFPSLKIFPNNSRPSARSRTRSVIGFSDLYLRKTPEESMPSVGEPGGECWIGCFPRELATGNHGGRYRSAGGIRHLSADWNRTDISFPRMGYDPIGSQQRRRRPI